MNLLRSKLSEGEPRLAGGGGEILPALLLWGESHFVTCVGVLGYWGSPEVAVEVAVDQREFRGCCRVSAASGTPEAKETPPDLDIQDKEDIQKKRPAEMARDREVGV